jgi:hypothetical protein
MSAVGLNWVRELLGMGRKNGGSQFDCLPLRSLHASKFRPIRVGNISVVVKVEI